MNHLNYYFQRRKLSLNIQWCWSLNALLYRKMLLTESLLSEFTSYTVSFSLSYCIAKNQNRKSETIFIKFIFRKFQRFTYTHNSNIDIIWTVSEWWSLNEWRWMQSHCLPFAHKCWLILLIHKCIVIHFIIFCIFNYFMFSNEHLKTLHFIAAIILCILWSMGYLTSFGSLAVRHTYIYNVYQFKLVAFHLSPRLILKCFT